jgi:hypothetical protein
LSRCPSNGAIALSREIIEASAGILRTRERRVEMSIECFGSSGEAYESVKQGVTDTGDVIVVESERMVSIAAPWPVAITAAPDERFYRAFPGCAITKEQIVEAVGAARKRGYAVKPEWAAIADGPMIQLLSIDGEVHIPHETGPYPLFYFSGAGYEQPSRIRWPLEADGREKLAAALFDAAEMGDIPWREREVKLPDGTILHIDGQ